ncbi:hypothetical protein Tcan_05589 [Toxocara canis]|uniref:Uncharacterized protein n=1 Tax=Toxocara canis TaxID=6265 RepID=A0A0B2VI81_TOXCA|nr:hypothetical protein Tcan_05589 [Toxocara canis]
MKKKNAVVMSERRRKAKRAEENDRRKNSKSEVIERRKKLKDPDEDEKVKMVKKNVKVKTVPAEGHVVENDEHNVQFELKTKHPPIEGSNRNAEEKIPSKRKGSNEAKNDGYDIFVPREVKPVGHSPVRHSPNPTTTSRRKKKSVSTSYHE